MAQDYKTQRNYPYSAAWRTDRTHLTVYSFEPNQLHARTHPVHPRRYQVDNRRPVPQNSTASRIQVIHSNSSTRLEAFISSQPTVTV
jgi:hypothetical protein